jgi:hypothetical protein
MKPVLQRKTNRRGMAGARRERFGMNFRSGITLYALFSDHIDRDF